MAIALLVTGVAVFLLLCVAVLRFCAARNVDGVLDDLDDLVRELPEGHRPPPGLGPISPSERTLSAEAERGLRDLQAFLLDAA
ncbi:MAG: hypothetical protein QOG99_3044 [Frankiales bacterium]|jgi:hypothetical protein|nr:hypothetical protein [Frankiales bacterium]